MPLEGAVLSGDSGYPCRDWLITPFLGDVDGAKKKYNTAHCATRNKIECVFGVLKQRFYILKTGIRLRSMEDAAKTVHCCAMIHNICIDHGDNSDSLEDLPSLNNVEFLDDPLNNPPLSFDRRRQQILLTFI